MAISQVIEILACSRTSWEDAAANTAKEASKTVRGIRGVNVQNQSAVVEKVKVAGYRLECKITFRVEQ
ncbi:MAG: dodecin domain-containing protein [Flavobacteriales bacterium]|nr:dodecin domain-containing protein [Flavobacteriales bacterium]